MDFCWDVMCMNGVMLCYSFIIGTLHSDSSWTPSSAETLTSRWWLDFRRSWWCPSFGPRMASANPARRWPRPSGWGSNCLGWPWCVVVLWTSNPWPSGRWSSPAHPWFPPTRRSCSLAVVGEVNITDFWRLGVMRSYTSLCTDLGKYGRDTPGSSLIWGS